MLNIFWSSHDPTSSSWSKQYRNVVFYHNVEQKMAAEKTRDLVAAQFGRRVHTDIEPASTFYPAEDYHPKFRLQQDPVLTEELVPHGKHLSARAMLVKANLYPSDGTHEYHIAWYHKHQLDKWCRDDNRPLPVVTPFPFSLDGYKDGWAMPDSKLMKWQPPSQEDKPRGPFPAGE